MHHTMDTMKKLRIITGRMCKNYSTRHAKDTSSYGGADANGQLGNKDKTAEGKYNKKTSTREK